MENFHSSIVTLDEKGRFFYRRFKNEFSYYGQHWEQLDISQNYLGLNRIVDFDIGPKDLIAIDVIGKIILFKDLISQG